MSARRGWTGNRRLAGLRRFATAITVLNVLGYAWLGFEPAVIQPLVALAVAYATEIGLEVVDAWARRRPLRFGPGREGLVDFLLSAHITGLAVSMLLYTNARVGPVAFAAAAAIASKAVLRGRFDGRERHLFNPSNLGIAVTLVLFPWVGIAPPYMFTENLGPVGDWALPGVIVVLGTLLNTLFTRRLPLIAAWVGGFALQGLARHLAFGQPLLATWMPMTGVAYLLFTFYMVTDPATTPERPRTQVLFGLAVAAVYGALMALHVVFGLFFALAIVTLGRALWVAARALLAEEPRPVPAALTPAPVARAEAWSRAAAARSESEPA